MNWFILMKLAGKDFTYGYWISRDGQSHPVEKLQYDERRRPLNEERSHIGVGKAKGWGNSYPQIMEKGHARVVSDPGDGGFGVEFEHWPTPQQVDQIMQHMGPHLRNARSINVQTPSHSIALQDPSYLEDILRYKKIPKDRSVASAFPITKEERWPDYYKGRNQSNSGFGANQYPM